MNIKLKTIVLLTVLPFSILAIDNANKKVANKNNFTLDLSDLKSFNFIEIEPNVHVHQDDLKTIKIITGKKGLNAYIDTLEQKLVSLESKSMQQDEFYFQQNKLLNTISLYQSKLESFQELKPENTKSWWTGPWGICYPRLYQNYTFNPSFFGISFTVESSYPALPGPFPPSQLVTIEAVSRMVIGTQYLYAYNAYTGGNYFGGSVSATSHNTDFFAHGQDSMWWDATSTMSQPNCFEYIHASGPYQ